jgi:hypothetical protein
MIAEGIVPAAQSEQDHATVRRFISLAVRGLVPMLDGQRQLFCYRLKKTDHGMVREGISQRYTAMTLMGLHRLHRAGEASPIDASAVLDALFSDLTWVDNVGDLGLLLWLCATVSPGRIAELERRLEPQTALARFKDARQGMTMELAWFLTGLSYWGQACPEELPCLEPLAFETYRVLTKNQSGKGIFGHLSTTSSIAGAGRGWIGTFADQVYPIYAMAQFSKAYHHEEAAERALKCAVGLCETQGPLGEWWWHYDSARGRVVEGYPVFSVHQHAMGPMVLFALGELLQLDFAPWIYKGLAWINSNNELGFDMEDDSRRVIWRSIRQSRRSVGKYLKAAFGQYADTAQHDRPEDLNVLFECRPYELGWLLYAFAQRVSIRRPAQDSPRAHILPPNQLTDRPFLASDGSSCEVTD